ncbi:MAG: sulfotransferase family protein [Marinibacterium sp.]|nr:sulfotransferase family protein [Marinibacterium sp.]
MLIIDDKVAIVHIKKCGGTTVCRALMESVPEDRMQAFGYQKEQVQASKTIPKEDRLWKHSMTCDLKRIKGDAYFKGLDVFCVSSRDPWSRAASFYFYAKRHNEKDPTKYPRMKDMSFDEFILGDHFARESLYDYAHDPETGECLVNRVLDFDNLDQETIDLAKTYGWPEPVMTRRNANPEEMDYLALYNKETSDHIGAVFAKEIEWLGFKPPVS